MLPREAAELLGVTTQSVLNRLHTGRLGAKVSTSAAGETRYYAERQAVEEEVASRGGAMDERYREVLDKLGEFSKVLHKSIHRRPSALRLLALAFALLAGLSMVLGAVLSDARAQAAPQYTFTKVADSVEDGFDPNSFGCAAINTRGDTAFKAGRLAPDGFNTVHGIYRANADGTLMTIAEDQKRFVFIGSTPR